ncbi:hypothetical protein V5O48_004281 [Marasmius crinis-equi]|uniref:RING-type domain-containing protein n=1 Tax=Marasmius crinis-equi TaxID=585013 RepID=A0ABR3FQK6_9AGAR
MTSLPAIDISVLEDFNSPGLRDRIRELVFEQLGSNTGSGQLSFSQKEDLIASFPRLEEKELISLGHQDSVCPICFNSLLAILAEEEVAIAMDSPAHPVEELGVTRLSQSWQCGHIFCRRDISRWVMDGHDSCPTCRRALIKTPESGSGSAAEGATPTVNAEDAYSNPADILNILEHIIGDGELLGAEGGRFIPNSLFGAQQGRTSTNLSNEYSAMYS